MLRTFAVLLLLGLATATPMVCLCAPDGVIGLMSQSAASESATSMDDRFAATDAPSLVASSAAAAVGSVVATAAGLPSAAPWQLRPPVSGARIMPPTLSGLLGQVWPPDAPPPQSA